MVAWTRVEHAGSTVLRAHSPQGHAHIWALSTEMGAEPPHPTLPAQQESDPQRAPLPAPPGRQAPMPKAAVRDHLLVPLLAQSPGAGLAGAGCR